MAVTKAKKAEVLQVLNDKFGRSKAVYFVGYRGLTVKKVTDLRKKLHAASVDYVVAKRTLMKLAAKNNNMAEIPDEVLKGPVAAVFSYEDVVMPAKLVHAFSKEAEQLELLGGIVDGRVLNKADAKAMAMLPSREELLAKLVGSLKSPISGFHGVLSGVLRNFVYTLNAIKDKQSSQA